MVDRRYRWIMWVAWVVAWVTLRPGHAQAKADVVPPVGWQVSSAAAPEAQRRASSWKQALGVPITQVMASPYDDRFRETLAVFTLPEPIAAADFDEESSALSLLQTTVANLVEGETATATALRETSAGETVAWGRWTVGKISYDCVLAPSGADATLVVVAVRANAVADHESILDGVVRDLTGVTAAMPAFSPWGWRIGSIIVWLCLALALHGLMLRFVDAEGDHNQAGRRAAMASFGLVLLGAIATHLALADRQLALEYAGTSREAMTMWVAVAGLFVAGLHFAIAGRLDRGYVQSAPASGVFASSSHSGSFIHASLSQSAMRVAELNESSVHARRRPPQATAEQTPEQLTHPAEP